jgi:GT2 family glycosyltransferase
LGPVLRTEDDAAPLPTVSVVVPARHIARWLPLQLEALAAQDYEGPVEVLLVVDVASSDGTAEIAKEWAEKRPTWRVIKAPPGGGIGQARNLGARASAGDVVLFCDGDDLADPGWARAMAEAAEKYEIFGGRLDYSRLGRPALSRRQFQKDGLSTGLAWRPFACGVSLGVSRRLFEKLGGFKEEFLRCEDLDFCWRAELAGYEVGFVPEAVMSYRQRANVRESLRQSYVNATWYPRLYREFRDKGMPSPGLRDAAREWGGLVKSLPRSLASAEARGRWMRWAAQSLGQIVGSAKHRVFWPASGRLKTPAAPNGENPPEASRAGSGTAQAREVPPTFAVRAQRALSRWRQPAYIRHKWRTEFVKTRFGLATLQDYLIDRRYGGSCGGTHASQWTYMGYHGTSSAHYVYLGRIFDHVKLDADDVLVDVGCGKGRVLNFWLQRGLPNRLVGIDIDPRFAGYTSRRLASFPNVEVLCGDALEVLPPDATVYFLFNPFKRDVMERFKQRLEESHEPAKRLTVVYYMAYFADNTDLFASDPDWEIYRVPENTFHPAIVAHYKPHGTAAALA